MYLGIDPGLRGGIVLLDGDLRPAQAHVMPLLAKQPAPHYIAEIIASMPDIKMCVLEKAQAGAFRRAMIRAQITAALNDIDADPAAISSPCARLYSLCRDAVKANAIGGGRGQSASAAFSYGRGYGMLIGVLSALKVPYQLVGPRTWQKVILSDTAKKDTKAAAVAVCSARLPTLDLRPGRARKPHDGLADAACMALYAHRLHTGSAAC